MEAPRPDWWAGESSWEEEDDSPGEYDVDAMPPPDQPDGRATRREYVYGEAMLAHHPVTPPPSDAQAVDTLIRFLIGMTGITMESDPAYYKYMYDWPITALIKFSKPCTNHWCGTAAVVLVEELAQHFPGTRALPIELAAYVTKLREMTELILQCYKNRVSQTPFALSTDPSKVSLSRIQQMMDKLRENGAPLPARRPPPQRCTPAPPCERRMTTPPRAFGQGTSRRRSTRTSTRPAAQMV